MSTTICQNKQNVYQFDKNQFEYSLFDLQTTTKTSSLKVSFLNGIQEQRSLIRQLQVKRVQGFWLALVGRENKSPKKQKPKSPKDFDSKLSMPEQQPPKKEKKRKEKKREEKELFELFLKYFNHQYKLSLIKQFQCNARRRHPNTNKKKS